MASLERGRVSSSYALAGKETPLIDRVEEVRLLKEAADRALHGEGSVIFLVGEAGIGKTRLARELRAYAHLRGMQVLYGRCPALFRMDGVPPYVLWREVIRDYLDSSRPEQLYRVIGFYPAEVAKLVPELRQRLGSIPESFPLSPEHEQNRLFEAVSQFITNISKETPLLVILDDLQWTDSSSLLLMHYLSRGVYRAPLLLLGAYRSTDVDARHPLHPVLTELNRERLLQSVQLKRMTLSDVSELIKGILEQDDVPSEFIKLVYEKTAGNPFFVEEVVKSLKEESIIFQEENKWKFKEVSKVEFPETVKTVIKTRIDRLDKETQNVLTLASFIGNDFTIEALCAVTEIEESKLLELLDELFKTGLIKEKVIRGEGICSFADILIRDVVYEEVSPLKRKKLHEVVGCALEQVYAKKIEEHLGELASHFLESSNKDKALDYYLKAGEKAARIYANDEAASYFESALELLQEKENKIQQKNEVLERLGDIKALAGEYDACLKYWNEKLLLLKQRRDEASRLDKARLHRKIAHVIWEGTGDTEKAVAHQNEALNMLEAEPESVELARLYSDMAHMNWRIGDVDKARSWGEKALEFAKKLNDNEIIATSCLELGTVFNMMGENKKARQFEETALEIALDNNYLETAARAYNNLTVTLLAEEAEKAIEYLEKAYELARKVGDINIMCWAGSNLAGSLSGAGELEKALVLSEEAVALDRKTGNQNHLTMSLGELGNEYRIRGDWDKSEKCLQEAFNIAQGLKDYQAVGMSYGYLAILYNDKGEYARALELGEKGYEIIEKTGDKMFQWWYRFYNTFARLELGENDEVRSLIDDLYKSALEVEAKTGTKQLIAYAKRLKARSLSAQGKWEESIEYFQKSLQDIEATNARKWNMHEYAKHFLCEYAQVYLDRDREGDKEKALKLLKQALAMFQKMGAKKDIERVEASIALIETSKVTNEPKPKGLIPTGIADLDKLLCGGLPSGYSVVLTSPTCDEKDMLVKSFLEAGAKKGEYTFYVTIDPGAAKPLAEEYQSSFFLFVCNAQADAIVKSQPNVFKLKGVENLTDISIALTSTILKLDTSLKSPRRICIGLVSDILLQHHAVQTRRWLTALMTEVKSAGFTTLAVVDPRMHPSEELYAILGLFEGEMGIYEKETEKGPRKYLKINKMSNHKHLENELVLKKEE